MGAGFPKPGEAGAGEWGSLYCDTPMRTFESMLDYIVEFVEPDMVFWTGDNSVHTVWNTTADEDVIYTRTVSMMI